MYYGNKTNSRSKIGKELVIWGVVMVVMVAIAVGDVGQDTIEADVNQPTDNGFEVSGSGSAKDTASEAIQSISFKKDMRIRDALRFLAAKYRKNIVPSTKVDGLITVTSLYDVTFEEAMDAILGYNFKCDQEGNFIKVYTAEEYTKIKEDKSRMVHRVFILYYTTASEARKLVIPVLSTASKIESTTAANTGVPVAETISSNADDGGDNAATNDVLIVYDYPENIAKVEEIIAAIDVRPKQVLIEATILSATLTDGMELGIDWQTLAGTLPGEDEIAIGDISRGTSDYFSNVGTGVSLGDVMAGGITVGLAVDNIAALIRAVEQITDVTIIANPKILAVNKQLGQVYIGKKVAYISQITQNDTSTTTQVEFLDTGTTLSFRPYIGDDGYIRMDIHPKDSSFLLRDVGGGDNTTSLPDETSAELVTNVIVKDGQTIVIGGLFRDKISTTRSQIPLLGDIPILGALFRGTADEVRREEVIILLTPHIITEPSQTNGYARLEDVHRKRIGAKDELQWATRTRLVEDRYGEAAKSYIAGDNDAALSQLDVVLELQPSYIDALRLRERILKETRPDKAEKLEKNIFKMIDSKQAEKWLSR